MPLCTIFTKWPAPDRPDASPSLVLRRRERFQQRAQILDRGFVSAHHHRVAFLESPDSAARAYVYKLESLSFQAHSAALRVFVIAVAAVDQNIIFRKVRNQRGNRFIDRRALTGP